MVEHSCRREDGTSLTLKTRLTIMMSHFFSVSNEPQDLISTEKAKHFWHNYQQKYHNQAIWWQLNLELCLPHQQLIAHYKLVIKLHYSVVPLCQNWLMILIF